MKKFNGDWFRERIYACHRNQSDLGRFLKMDKATVHNMLAGRRRLQLAEVEPLAQFLDATPFEVLTAAGIQFRSGESNGPEPIYEPITEVDAKKLHKSGGDMTKNNLQKKAVAKETWGLPVAYAHKELSIDGKKGVILEVLGDSMEPTLSAGDRVMIDTKDITPSPPGIFALWDGISVVMKRVEHVLGSSPPAIKAVSDNPRHGEAVMEVESLVIVGRVIWTARKI